MYKKKHLKNLQALVKLFFSDICEIIFFCAFHKSCNPAAVRMMERSITRVIYNCENPIHQPEINA